METITFKPIGIISTPFKDPKGTPIQAAGACGVSGRIQIFPDYAPGLQDLQGFSHVILLYAFHLCRGFSLKVLPFLDEQEHGVFATRAPARPNSIGLSIVRLERVEGDTLLVQDVDMVDGSPLVY